MTNSNNNNKTTDNGSANSPIAYEEFLQKVRASIDTDRQRFIDVLRELLKALQGDVSKGVSLAEGLVTCLSNVESRDALISLRRILGDSSTSIDANSVVQAFQSMTTEQLQVIGGLLKQYIDNSNSTVSASDVVNAFTSMTKQQLETIVNLLGDIIKESVKNDIISMDDTTYSTLWDKLAKHLTLAYITTIVESGSVEARAAFKNALEKLLDLKTVDDKTISSMVTDYLRSITAQEWASYIDASEIQVNAPNVTLAAITNALKTGDNEQRAVARSVILELLDIKLSPEQVSNAVDTYLTSLTAEQLLLLLPSLSQIIDDQIAEVLEYLRANDAFACDLSAQTSQMNAIRVPEQ